MKKSNTIEVLFEIEKCDHKERNARKVIFCDYSKARKHALRQVVKKNTSIMINNWSVKTNELNSLFLEKEPDYWTDGKEKIKIIAIEIKS